MVEEMLEAGIIRPSQSSYSALKVMVHKKEGSWHMCPNYRERWNLEMIVFGCNPIDQVVVNP